MIWRKTHLLWLVALCLVVACKKDDDPQLKLSDSELAFDNLETKSLCLFVEPFKKCSSDNILSGMVGNNPANMKEYDAIPYFVFCNSDGNKIVVITKANNSGLEYE